MPHSCEWCRDIVLKPEPKVFDVGRASYSEEFIILDEERVREALASNCALTHVFLNHSRIIKRDKPVPLTGRLSYFQGVWRLRFYTRGILDSSATCELLSPINSPGAKWISARSVNLHPRSNASRENALKWLRLCQQTHPKCKGTLERKGKFPTRILRINWVNEEYNLQIVIAKEWVPYVALSYCWGGDQKHKTTEQRLRETGGRVDFSALPLTIQDAVRVTHDLGFEYLWVDSICIVQDNSHDKMYEIGRMPVVYSQASLTIVVSRASSTQEGFVGQRSDHKEIDLQLQLPDETHCKVKAIEESVPLEPLDTRGWALQERILSDRILEFTNYQTRWLCKGVVNMENRIRYVDGGPLASFERHRRDSSFLQPEEPSSLMSPDWIGRWRNLVQEYSKRNLTKPSDRPLAISAIATRLYTLLKSSLVADEWIPTPPDIYLAGHWLSSLPQDLLWGAEDGASRPKKYQGPSWSWTAINGEIDFLRPEIAEIENKLEADLIDHKITVQDETAPFGAVTEGILTVRARLKSASARRQSLGGTESTRLSVESMGPGYTMAIQWDAAESDFSSDAEHLVHMLLISTYRDEAYNDDHGLLLRQVAVSSKTVPVRFSRLGIFEIRYRTNDIPEKEGVFHDCGPEIVELV